MVKKSIKFEVDDFLDLYLLAEQLGDKGWQGEIIKQLKNPTDEIVEEDQLLTIHNLWLEKHLEDHPALDIFLGQNHLRFPKLKTETNYKPKHDQRVN